MQYLAICEDDLLFQFMRNVAAKQGEVVFLVEEEAVAKRIRRQRGKVRQGDLLKEETGELKLGRAVATIMKRNLDKAERV